MYPTDAKYAENIRLFQGCPPIAVTRGGRIYLGWYSGGTKESHIDYDRGRTAEREILFMSFTEEDIMREDSVFVPHIVSKP